MPVVRPLPELPQLHQIKNILSTSSIQTPLTSVNGTGFTGNLIAMMDKEAGGAAAEKRRKEECWAEHAIHDDARTSMPELAALRVPISTPPLAASAILSPAFPQGNKLNSSTVGEDVGLARRTVLRLPPPTEGLQPVPPSAQNRRIKFMLDAHDDVGDAPRTSVLAPAVRQSDSVRASRGDVPLHSEAGMYELEYLDEGGKVQRRLTAFYQCCADQIGLDEEDAEVMFADHLGPFLRESRQFRVYVADDIDRACGVVNTAVTLCAKEEQEVRAVGSVASDNGTDTMTLTGTVVNALKENDAQATSELHESYQPLQGAVFESALRKAWEWTSKARAEAPQAVEAGACMGSMGLSRSAQRSRLAEIVPAMLTSTNCTELSQVITSIEASSASAIDYKGGGSRALPSNSAFSNGLLPIFKAEVKASLQIDSNNDPHAPLSALQVAACALCAAEMTSRKILWTSFLAERYEQTVAIVEVGDKCGAAAGLSPLPESFSAVLKRNAAGMQRYLNLTLEEYLPWIGDVYLAVYKPVALARPAAEKQSRTDDGNGGVVAGLRSNTSTTRKFRSVLHADQRPQPLTAQRAPTRGMTPMPFTRNSLSNGSPAAHAEPYTTASNQPIIFTVSFLFGFSFLVLQEIGLTSRTQATDNAADAMHLLLPAASSFTRDSFFTSLTHSASLAVVSDSTTTAAHGHDAILSARSAGGGGGGFGGGQGGAVASSECGTPDLMAAMERDSLTNTSVRSRLQPHWAQVPRPRDPVPLQSDGLLMATGALSETSSATPPPTTTNATPAVRKPTRRYSTYEHSQVWLKMLFRFFRNDEAHSFLNDSPISMRNFFPLPHVSWERVLLRAQSIMAWFEFHHAVADAATGLWGYKDKMRSSPGRNKKLFDPKQWERALRHSEQEALNMAAATHELWFMALEWWLRTLEGLFWTTAPAPRPPTHGSIAMGRRHSVDGSATPLRTSSSPQLPPSRSTVLRPLRPFDLARVSPKALSGALEASLLAGTSASRRPSLQSLSRSPQEHDMSFGSPPSVPSSEMVWGSNATITSKKTMDSILQSLLLSQPAGTPQVKPALQRLGDREAPQQLQASLTSTMDSSSFSLSSRSNMSPVSRSSLIHKHQHTIHAQATCPEHAVLSGGKTSSHRVAVLPDVVLPSSGIINIATQWATHGIIEADLSCNTSRLLVPPMAATIAGLFKGNASDWDMVLLVRSQSLTRALWDEQQLWEWQLLRQREASSLRLHTACAAMEEALRAEENVWLAHRRNTARYLWDQVHMEKTLLIQKWARERVQQDFVMYAVLSLESLFELYVDALSRLVEDFHLLIREARSWMPSQTVAHRRLTTAALALGPSHSTTTLEDRSDLARNVALAEAAKTQASAPPKKPVAMEGTVPFDFWGYGAFLPSADSPVGFNDGLVVMSRLCRDMRLRGRRLRTHWFVNQEDKDEDDQCAAASRNFHDIHYANHDTYTGFTRVRMGEDSVEENEAEMEMDETHTPRGRTDSMTDIHRDGECGAGQMLRHGLGNYSCKALGYTYVGGWHLDRPHGDGALLYNGAFPWETRNDGTKKSLLLIFGRWEHGRLAHLELSFSGVPLS